MLSITIAAHRILKWQFESSMRQAVIAYINKDISRSSKSGLLARRIMSPNLCFPPDRRIHTSEADFNGILLFSSGNIEVLSVILRPIVDINGWTFYLETKDKDEWEKSSFFQDEDLYLQIEADQITDTDLFISEHKKWWTEDTTTVKLEDMCRRIAWNVGPPFYIVLACTRKKFAKVMDAYMSDLLVTDDPLLIRTLSIVHVIGRPVDLIRSDSTTSITSREPTFNPLPNIILFDTTEPDSLSVMTIEKNLNHIIDLNTFVIYRLSNAEWEAGSWSTCAHLLICLCEKIGDVRNIKKQVIPIVQKHRITVVLLLPADGNFEEKTVVMERCTKVEFDGALGRLFYLKDITDLTTESKLITLLTALGIKCQSAMNNLMSIPEETPLILCTGNDVIQENTEYFYKLFQACGYRRIMTDDEFNDCKSHLIIPRKSLKLFEEVQSNFRFDVFFEDQNEFLIPITLVHADVLSSSWTIMTKLFSKLPKNSGLIITSSQQTEGKGRGKNSWISPVGQLQMTLHCSTKLESPLCQCPSIFQHMIALMLVTAIEDTVLRKSGDINIRLKWPNDIYWISNGISYKLGGIISQASFQSEHIHFIVGIGLNVSNEKPTVCLYNALRLLGYEENELPSIESIMRRTIINIQTAIRDLESGHLTLEAIRRQYENRWLHSNQVITMNQDKNTSVRCRIIGIDRYGFLLVKDTQNQGETFTLHPDGNSFDLLHNLIRPK